MRTDAELFFDEHPEHDIGGDFIKERETVDADHGRIETRRYTVCVDTSWLTDRHKWPGLKAVIMTEYTREIRGQAETVRQFYISSFVDSPEKMSRHIRNHWQVENSLHWVLDVPFRQDDCRIRNGNAAANFVTINHSDTLKSPVCFLASGDGRAFAAAMRVGPLPGLWFGMWFRRGRAMPRRPCAPGTRAVSG